MLLTGLICSSAPFQRSVLDVTVINLESWGKKLMFIRVESAVFLSMVPQYTKGEVSHNCGPVLMSWILIMP